MQPAVESWTPSPSPRPARRAEVGLRWEEVRVLVIDTETTGISVTDDRVIELGAVYFDRGRRAEVRRMRINPERLIPAEASKIHGIHDVDLVGKPTFREVAERFLAHVDGSARDGEVPHLAGYNATHFDVPLLNAELERAGLSQRIDPNSVLDLMIFIRWHHRSLRSRSLESICQHYRIELERAHSATADAAATGHLLLQLVTDGLVPERVDLALAEQIRLQQILQEEWRRFSYWLYRDRQSGDLRLGAGRHCGALLDEIEADYLDYLLHKIPDLPDEVRTIFQQRAA